MWSRHVVSGLFLCVAALFWTSIALADNEGQADLDQATEAKLTAENLDDLGEVIRLCRKALAAGLDEDNSKFATEMLKATLSQRAEALGAQIFARSAPPPRWPELRRLALADLEESLKLDADQLEAQSMVARLESLPGGDRKRALAAADETVRLTDNEPLKRSKALMLRAALTTDTDKRRADLDEAVKLAPNSLEAVRSRGVFLLLELNKYEEALADFDTALALDPESAETYEAKGVAQFMLKKYDDALATLEKAIELAPASATAYMHRGRIYAVQGESKKALTELNKALALQPRSPTILLLRARVHQQAGSVDKALKDVETVLQLRPKLAEAVQLHAILAAGSGRLDMAITDLEELKTLAPTNPELLLQLGYFYTADKKPQKAIDAFTEVLAEDAKNWLAHRGRADALLNLGKQAEAVVDYEAALKLQPDNSGVLNNLAWILATSPDEKLRDGKRSIELATEACKITEYKEAHIVSTLAAGYAENGDFDTAVEWSEKALALGKPAIKDQLAKELASYQEHKPWRETQPPELMVEESTQEASDSADKSASKSEDSKPKDESPDEGPPVPADEPESDDTAG